MRLRVASVNNYNLRLASANKLSLSIGMSMGEESHEHYQGEYVITPKVTAQMMQTDDKIMDDDVTINAITYSAVDNPYGGQTVQIGEI